MKAYLNTNVISAIPKKEFPSEILALNQLMDSFDAGKLDLRTSKVAHTEIERYAGMKKREMNELYHRLEKVPFVEDHELLGFHSQWDCYGGVSSPLVEDDSISSALRKMGLDRPDAHHLMLAIHAYCDVFLTYDKKTILNRGAKIEGRFHIRLMKPSALVEEFADSGEGDETG